MLNLKHHISLYINMSSLYKCVQGYLLLFIKIQLEKALFKIYRSLIIMIVIIWLFEITLWIIFAIHIISILCRILNSKFNSFIFLILKYWYIYFFYYFKFTQIFLTFTTPHVISGENDNSFFLWMNRSFS